MGIDNIGARMDAFNKAVLAELEQQIEIQLNYLGQECVEKARNRPSNESWIDRTGNLRSSIGAVVVRDGKNTICEGLKPVGKGSEGVQVATKLLQNQKAPQGKMALVVIAGMEYASYVENMDGKDVLASTELWARKELGGRIQDAVDNAAYRINNMTI